MNISWTLDIGNMITLVLVGASVIGVFADIRSRIKQIEKELSALVDVVTKQEVLAVRFSALEERVSNIERKIIV